MLFIQKYNKMKFRLNRIAQIALLILFTCNTFATNITPEEEILSVVDPGSDPGTTPIATYILPMLFLGIAISFWFLKKKTALVK